MVMRTILIQDDCENLSVMVAFEQIWGGMFQVESYCQCEGPGTIMETRDRKELRVAGLD